MAGQAVDIGIACGQPTGRLLKVTPSANEVEVLADGFVSATGMDLSHDESSALVMKWGELSG